MWHINRIELQAEYAARPNTIYTSYSIYDRVISGVLKYGLFCLLVYIPSRTDFVDISRMYAM
jgi:hypothetical protein